MSPKKPVSGRSDRWPEAGGKRRAQDKASGTVTPEGVEQRPLVRIPPSA
jgi:hypothetical protein